MLCEHERPSFSFTGARTMVSLLSIFTPSQRLKCTLTLQFLLSNINTRYTLVQVLIFSINKPLRVAYPRVSQLCAPPFIYRARLDLVFDGHTDSRASGSLCKTEKPRMYTGIPVLRRFPSYQGVSKEDLLRAVK